MSKHYSVKDIIDDQRSAQRYETRLPIKCSFESTEFEAYIRSVSLTGMLIEASTALSVDTKIEITLPGSGPAAAKVIWSDGMIGSCSFDTPLQKSVLNAVRLKGYPIGTGPHASGIYPSAMLLTDREESWSGVARLSSLVLATLASWAVVVLAIWMIF